MRPRIHRYANCDLVVDELSERIAALARRCCEERGCFRIVLAGGNTPRALYEQLRYLGADWQGWHIYFGDERCLPVGDPDRNDSMAAEAWLDHVAIPRVQINRVPEGDANAAAAAYDAVLAEVPGFDLVLLGLGEDGHTASLFPGAVLVSDDGLLAIAIDNAPKPPPQRVSMSAQCLSRATAVWFLVCGTGKQRALAAWLAGEPLPPQQIRPRAGVDIFTDLVW